MPHVYLFDTDYSTLGRLDESFRQLEVVERYQGIDTFSMAFDAKSPLAPQAVNGRLLYLPSEDNALFLIEQVQEDVTEEKDEKVVSGRSIDGFSLMERRVDVTGLGYDTQSAVPAETAMKYYVNAHAGPGAAVARQVPGLVIATDQVRGINVTIKARFQTLLVILQEIGRLSGLGWRAPFDVAAQNIPFDIVQGTNRTASVFFDFDFETLKSWALLDSLVDSKTVAIVAGQGELAARDIVKRWQGTEPAGFARREDFIDARDVELGNTTLLTQRGDAFLEARAPERALEAKIHEQGSFQLGTHWFNGDIVTVRNKARDISYAARVIEVQKVWRDTNVPEVTSVLDKPIPGWKDQIERVSASTIPIVDSGSGGGGTHPDLTAHDTLGLATQTELDAHFNDPADAHDASAVSILDVAGYFAGADVEAALKELAVPGPSYVTSRTDGSGADKWTKIASGTLPLAGFTSQIGRALIFGHNLNSPPVPIGEIRFRVHLSSDPALTPDAMVQVEAAMVDAVGAITEALLASRVVLVITGTNPATWELHVHLTDSWEKWLVVPVLLGTEATSTSLPTWHSSQALTDALPAGTQKAAVSVVYAELGHGHTHASTTGKTADDHHAQAHSHGAAAEGTSLTPDDVSIKKFLNFYYSPGNNKPAALTGDVNNYSPAALNTTNLLLLTSTVANVNISGIDTSVFGGYQRLLFIQNFNTVASGRTITLLHESLLSSAANRWTIAGGTDLVIPPQGMVIILRNQNDGRLLVAHIPGAGGGALTDHTHAATGSGVDGGGLVLRPTVIEVQPEGGSEGGEVRLKEAYGADYTNIDVMGASDAAEVIRVHKSGQVILQARTDGTKVAPTAQAFGDAANAGTDDSLAFAGHKHAMPANPVTAHAVAGAHPISGVVATRTDNLTVPSATETPLTWPTEERDTDDYHSTVTNTDRLVAPFTGWYEFVVQVDYQSAFSGTVRSVMGVYVDGGASAIFRDARAMQGAGVPSQAMSGILYLTAGQYIAAQIYHASSTSELVQGRMAMVYLGA